MSMTNGNEISTYCYLLVTITFAQGALTVKVDLKFAEAQCWLSATNSSLNFNACLSKSGYISLVYLLAPFSFEVPWHK